MEPGNINIETPENIINNEIENNNGNVTLMGENDKNDRIKFKNISKCYQEIFNENVDNIMNEINEETIGNKCLVDGSGNFMMMTTDANGNPQMNDVENGDDVIIMQRKDIYFF